ncbi:hypothetical protein [Streptomyces sp. NPDC055400]
MIGTPRPKTVARELASSCVPTSGVSSEAWIPEPTTTATSAAVPSPSTVARRISGAGALEQVNTATTRLKDVGLATFEENDTSCCYALQDKVWVIGPGKESWEVYIVKADAYTLGKSVTGAPDACCGTTT